MTLIDFTYINSQGGLNIAQYVLEYLREREDYNDFLILLDKRNFYTFSKTYTYDGISLPKKNDKYFLNYKQFVFLKIKRNKINIIYKIGTDIDKSIIYDLFGKDCLKILEVNEILVQYDVSKCQK